MVPIGARFAYDNELCFVYLSFVFVPKSIHVCAFAMGQHMLYNLERTSESSRTESSRAGLIKKLI